MKITINTQPKADEDIFKAGTLVCSDKNVVFITNDTPYSEGSFSGVILKSYDYPVGHHNNTWDKSCFVKFIGNILLEQ